MTFLSGEQGEPFKFNLYDHGCGLAVADYDGDGHDDLLLLNQLGANALYRNRGEGSFERVSQSEDPIALTDRVCVGATFGDYDNDGDEDLYITSTRGGNVLLRNDGGEFVDLTADARGRQVQAAGGYLSQSSNTLHFGLGDCRRIDRAEIRWPTGQRQTIASPPVNQLTGIREPS